MVSGSGGKKSQRSSVAQHYPPSKLDLCNDFLNVNIYFLSRWHTVFSNLHNVPCSVNNNNACSVIMPILSIIALSYRPQKELVLDTRLEEVRCALNWIRCSKSTP